MSTERLYLERVAGNPAMLGCARLGALAALYANVFAGDPWNEYTACSVDNTFFGRTTQPGDSCPQPDCNGILALAYPQEKTADYIAAELTRPDAVLWLLRDAEKDGKEVGFSWGFSYANPEDFAQDKYKTPAMQASVRELLRRLNLGAGGLWYLSESGIEDSPNYRGQGLSKLFHERRLEVARSLGLDAIQRTNSAGNMYRTSRRTMTQIMGPAMEADGASRRLVTTGEIVNGVADTEMPSRVLFARRSETNPTT